MAKILTVVTFIIVFVIAVFLVVTRTKRTTGSDIDETVNYKSISSETLKEMLDTKRDDFFFLDVRTRSEYEAGRIENPDALIPYDEIEQREDKLPSKDTKIALYCRSGRRSAIAASKLVKMGYKNILNLDGGILDWEKKGFKINK